MTTATTTTTLSLRFLIVREIENAKNDEDCEYAGSEEASRASLEIDDRMKSELGYEWEQDENAVRYFLKATPAEIYEHMLGTYDRLAKI